MSLLDIPTAYFIVGLLFLLVPASGWLVLGTGSSATVTLWCGGGVVFGIGMMLISGRAVLPVWLSYPVAIGLAFLGLSMKASSLSAELGRRVPARWMLSAALVMTFVFEWLREADLQVWRFTWGAGALALLFGLIAVLAFRLARQAPSHSARWLGVVYSIGAVQIAVRSLGALAGVLDPAAEAPGMASVLTLMMGLTVSVVGTMGFVGIFLDRARRQEVQSEADRARREEAARLGSEIARMERLHVMNALSASLAHELNQPLTAILTNAQLARHMVERPFPRATDLRPLMIDIERDTQRASQVLQHARNYVRTGDPLRVPVVLQRVVQEVLELAAGEIRASGLALNTQWPDEPVTVQGDPVQLAQVVLNLLLNALQASQHPAPGGIQLRLWARHDTAVLTVRDHGQGIEPAALPQLGHPFFTTKADGTGLGLSIAHHLAEQHGGQLVLRNATQGGAVATLTLPCARALPASRPDKAA